MWALAQAIHEKSTPHLFMGIPQGVPGCVAQDVPRTSFGYPGGAPGDIPGNTQWGPGGGPLGGVWGVMTRHDFGGLVHLVSVTTKTSAQGIKDLIQGYGLGLRA